MIFKKTGKVYAIKEMSKTKIIDKNSVDSIQGEREILSYLHHPFIVNMVYAFQDRDFLYLVMELLPGGNLRYHLGLKKRFTEEQTSKFKYGCDFEDYETKFAFEYNQEKRTLAFYKNDIYLGVAFNNVPPGLTPAFEIWFETGIIKISDKSEPLEKVYL